VGWVVLAVTGVPTVASRVARVAAPLVARGHGARAGAQARVQLRRRRVHEAHRRGLLLQAAVGSQGPLLVGPTLVAPEEVACAVLESHDFSPWSDRHVAEW